MTRRDLNSLAGAGRPSTLEALSRKLINALGSHSLTDLGMINARDVQRYLVAIGDPLPSDEADVLTCPPGFLLAVQDWSAGLPEGLVKQDGIGSSSPFEVLTAGFRVMGGGATVEFMEPIYVGDKVAADEHLHSADIKAGRSGAFLLVTRETTYVVDGRPRQRIRRRSLVRPPVEESSS